MLTPEYLDSVAEPLQVIYSELQGKIEQDLARRISKAGKITETAQFQILKLSEMGESQAYIQQQLAEALKMSDKEVYRLFKEAGLESIKTDIATQKAAIKAGVLPADTVPLSASATVAQVLNANAIRTQNTLKKLTGTIAIDANGKLNKYMDQAQLMVQSGAFTEQQAINATVPKFAAEGVSVFDYVSGTHTVVEAAVRRALVTGVNQATAEISLNNASELETDLVEVTSHADARPAHASWQGGIYSLSGNSKKYRKLSEATGYGTGAGLCGWNCRHSFFAYIEGISDKLPKEEYNPKTYEAEQKQRYNERQIRYWKRRADTVEAGGADNTTEKAKVAYWQARQRDHVTENKLSRLYDREKVYNTTGAIKINTQKVASEANKLYNTGTKTGNLRAYLRDKPVRDELAPYKIDLVSRINNKEYIVSAGKPQIAKLRLHAIQNQAKKPDRAGLTQEVAQSYIDKAKLTLYQVDKGTVKFLSEKGYSVLNLDNELVTAVPQKWRGKYDKYLKGE